MKLAKYFKPLDFIQFGLYITLFSVAVFNGDLYYLILLLLVMVHYYPLIYLLRKHGYLKLDDFGYYPTRKGIEFFTFWMLTPIEKIINTAKTDKVCVILTRVLLVLLLFPVILLCAAALMLVYSAILQPLF